MSHQITKHTFYRYLKCPSWVAHDAKGEHAEHALRVRLQEDGLLRQVQRELLEKRGKGVVEVHKDDIDAAAFQTLEFMRSGAQTIYGATLILDHFVAQPDFLEKVQGKSGFGDYYYVACDIKRSRAVKPEYKMQGCFYADILEKVQKVKPVQGYVMHPNGGINAYLVAETEGEYRLTLDAIERILDGEDEPHFLTSDCKQSPWFHACKADAVQCDDISRLNRIWRSEAKELVEAGFATVTEFAKTHLDLVVARVHGITRERLNFLHLQAQALVHDRITVLRTIDVPESHQCLVVDIESDPLRNVDYLFGVLVVEGDKAVYHAFLAKDPSEEEQAWKTFVAFIKDYIGYPLYHYGSSEQDTFRHLGEKYATDVQILTQLSEQGVDLLERVREAVIFPLSFYSLKDIAQHLGFRWRHDDASGLNSVLWYEEWLTKHDEKALQDVIDYNEDDVRATLHLLRWAEKQSL